MFDALLCLIVGVSDGDTLTARCGQPDAYEQRKVRLAGVDAPEKAQPFGIRSRQSLAQLCFHQEAKVEHAGTDRYGRALANVECRGQDASAVQIRAGMAMVYRQFTKGRSDLFRLEESARTARVGLWADPSPVPPWEWRRKTGVR